VPLVGPIRVRVDDACAGFAFAIGRAEDLAPGAAAVGLRIVARAPGLAPGFGVDAIARPAVDLVYHDPALGPVELGTGEGADFATRVWRHQTGPRVKGTYAYAVQPTERASGSPVGASRKVVFAYDFAFPAACAPE
jgi:hypothetical protein